MTENNKEKLSQRSPIVVVMGHVDHGKTTLLDYIRKTNVAGREAGGITQSVGAYEITHARTDAEKNADLRGQKITFIDTPGHEVFSKMRSRGAGIADLAILVVAGDEGIKPQTKESIKILEDTKTPFVVALTKIDKPNADIEKIKNELSAAGVFLEGYGGQISFQPVSAKNGEGINELLDLILLTAELENLEYEPAAAASGYVLEAKVDRQRGLEATLIVKNGVLRAGDFISTPTIQAKIKILENFLGEPVKEITPSAPALVIGFETLPQAGEEFSVIKELKEMPAQEPRKMAPKQNPGEELATLRLILKASDGGSLEALSGIVKAIAPSAGAGNPITILGESVGDVNDNDVKLAISSQAIIISFKSRADKTSKNLAEINKVKIISSEIIYELLKAIEDFLKELETPKPTGILKILAIFNQSSPQKQVVGGKVESGIFKNKAVFEIEREGKIIGSGRTLNLQQQKKDATEVNEGKEAGLLVNSETLLKANDNLLIQAKTKL